MERKKWKSNGCLNDKEWNLKSVKLDLEGDGLVENQVIFKMEMVDIRTSVRYNEFKISDA